MRILGMATILTVLFGLVFLGVGWLISSHETERQRTALHASGEVIENAEFLDPEMDRNRPEAVMYAPRLRFTTASGQSFEFLSTTRTRPARYAVGERVPVLYDPARPSEASIESSDATGAVFTGVGIFVLVIAGVLTAFGVALRRQRPA